MEDMRKEYKVLSNRTSVINFVLLGISGSHDIQILCIILFLIMYLFILVGNLLIILLIAINSYLHTPMYFFLINLSTGDLGCSSVIIPKVVFNTFMNSTWISYSECGVQMFFILFFLTTNLFILTIMAYDRYIAICYPLHFASIMKGSTCLQMAGGAWMFGFLHALLHTGNIFSMPFCSNIINQLFCEVPQLIKLVCSDSYLSETWILVISSVLGVGCLIFIILSYVQIFSTVLRMPSVERREKAFSTCIPHFIVVSLFVGNSLLAHLAYLMPTFLSKLEKSFTVLYTLVPSLMNPVIYSMRNKDIKSAFWNCLGWKHFSKK
ncbi:olfactory receptor 14I1-like [Crotalus tigris]|uniref:olfactory receptor 14I1-like n=1 Tax=Crotalus tigris TaxID=88082 RepID=UPI00192F5146|nr:olfactory receptor 14I1-like [Crotalus tigris]